MGYSHTLPRNPLGRTIVFKFWLGKTDTHWADDDDSNKLMGFIRKSSGPAIRRLTSSPTLLALQSQTGYGIALGLPCHLTYKKWVKCIWDALKNVKCYTNVRGCYYYSCYGPVFVIKHTSFERGLLLMM